MREIAQSIELVAIGHDSVQIHTSPIHVGTCHYDVYQEKGWINGPRYILCSEERFKEFVANLDRYGSSAEMPEPATA